MNKTSIVPIFRELIGQGRQAPSTLQDRSPEGGPLTWPGESEQGPQGVVFELGLSESLGVCQVFRIGKNILNTR